MLESGRGCQGDPQARGSNLCGLGSESAGCFYLILNKMHAWEMQPRVTVRRRGAGGIRAEREAWCHGAVQEGSWWLGHVKACSSLLQPVFHVMGFSVTGRVLNGPDGEGVPEAVVTLNNQIKGGQARWS